ncbi:hypothetical protein TL16_g01994 [Triparma laevis f. inornata]|uniref:Uncharacterized protein n=1 Tax=Triparma laevis f. inornata TaxID=1714386 RepID=A0A9W6ZTR9_9STRA|nr:hypothetical protein TL16_g01994 [Triparma laevis f. inornata]
MTSTPAALVLTSTPALAEGPPAPLTMTNYVDKEEGEFALRVPTKFYILRRKDKGDLPDKVRRIRRQRRDVLSSGSPNLFLTLTRLQNGNGRRGATIFTAGNMASASVIAVERFPVKSLLDEAGIASGGDLTSFGGLGIGAEKLAELLNLRREKERNNSKARTLVMKEGGNAPMLENETLRFQLRSDIDVQKPELLLEQEGVSELVRFTDAKALIKKGEMYVIYGGALRQFYEKEEGEALKDAVASFTVLK